MIRIAPSEFQQRVERIQEAMAARRLDAVFVYGDEYRKENLRYVSNVWPIFERGACCIPATGEPILAGAPEGERVNHECSVWRDVRNIREFACVSVPEQIEYPLATFSSLKEILKDVLRGGRRLGLVGTFDIPSFLMERLKAAMPSVEIVSADDLVVQMRLVKSKAEISCLKESGRQCCVGYKAILKAARPGVTERAVAGAGEGAARAAGSEAINFHVFGSGKRCRLIIPRTAPDRVLRAGDMLMSSMAVQYEGYTTTAQYPFVVGHPNAKQRDFLNILLEAANVQLSYLRPGVVMGEMVAAVKKVFEKHRVTQYDVYPPMHGCGLAEAESPYPSEKSRELFREGMCVNSDISLFGHPAGSNRIEEGFAITAKGPESLTPLIRSLCEKGI